jgi:adenine deaminase
VLRAACINPVLHYKLNVGLLRVGDHADFIIVEDLTNFKIIKTYINGQLVAENGVSKIEPVEASIINQFDCSPKTPADFAVKNTLAENETIWVMEALDGQLITNKVQLPVSVLKNKGGYLQSNPAEDILKIAVVNRYEKDTPVQTAWIKNFGLKHGAIASSVAHDSHNIIAVGVDDERLCKAVNLVIGEQGGVSCVSNNESSVLGLPVAGLMSNLNGYKVAEQYTAIDKMAKTLGSTLSAPFMTLSFMALLVIPHLKISDKGLFDGDNFTFLS